MMPHLGDIENVRRALLELAAKQRNEPWIQSERKSTLQQMLHLLGNQGLLPTTKDFLKTHGYLHCPESMWALVKATPNHYFFRTALVQIAGVRRLRYQVLHDPGNGRYKYMAEEVWKLDLRVWQGGQGSIPSDRSVGDVIEVASSVACLAPYFVSVTSNIKGDSLLEQWLEWSNDITANILQDPAPHCPPSPRERTSIGRRSSASREQPSAQRLLPRSPPPNGAKSNRPTSPRLDSSAVRWRPR